MPSHSGATPTTRRCRFEIKHDLSHELSVRRQGIDGTDGNQPRFTHVIGNVAREIGHYEKQSSFYVQGKSCQNIIQGNGAAAHPRLTCTLTSISLLQRAACRHQLH